MTKNFTTSGFRSRIVHNLIILDESGSMQAIKAATIQGFNETVQTIKGIEKQFPEQEHFISLITFNGLGIKPKLFAKKVEQLAEIDENIFRPDASTPLYDAIGFSVNKLRQKLILKNDYHVLVTILTDGQENASQEYTSSAIKELIEELKKQNWTFTYIGANHNVKEAAFCLAIPNALKFEANSENVERLFAKDKKARGMYARKLSRGEDLQERYFDDADDEAEK